MTTDWTITRKVHQPSQHEYSNVHILSQIQELSAQDSVKQCIDKAITLLTTNIEDDSLYFLLEWNKDLLQLRIVVTDEEKQNDGKEVVLYNIKPDNNTENLSENICYWARDYLTTNDDFNKFSLVAVFHNSQRDKTQLL